MKFKFSVTGLDCPNCAMKLSAMIEKKEGIESAKINFLTEKLTIESSLSSEEVLGLARAAGVEFSSRVVIE